MGEEKNSKSGFPEKPLDLDVQEEHGEGHDPKIKKRETWNTKFDFLLACIGFSVGLGNVWRFPYLCYKNGGGAFLIPYFICVVLGGIPLFFLEVAVGQFMGVAGLGAWNICPIFQGIGVSTTIIVFFLNCYYNVILCWAFYYMFSSFTLELPWAKCGNWWNTCACDEFAGSTRNRTESDNSSFANETVCNLTRILKNGTAIPLKLDPVSEFWNNKVLAMSDGIENMGTIKWDLALTLLFAWIVVYLCICKGIRSSGRVMYVTATSPYIFMLALLIRNSLLPGAADGVLFYLKPNIAKLADMEVWVDAGTQIFFSYSISLGALTALGSYNDFHHNCFRDAILFACANSGTSFFAGFIIFTILGHMSFLQQIPIDRVAAAGPGLAFIAYPKAVSLMPGAPIWSVLFFLMVVLLGLDSQFVGVEGVVTAVVDQWPHILRRGYRKEIFIACVCVLNFFVGLSMVTNGGMYVFQLFDYYSGSKIILFVGAFMCIAVGWIYGAGRFYDNIEMMIGRRIWPHMYIGWVFTAPVFCMVVFIMSIINYSELTYDRPEGIYNFPSWAVAIGWSMAALSAVFIPGVAIAQFFRFGFSLEVLKLLLKPKGFQEHQLRPQDRGERTLDDLIRERKGLPYVDRSAPQKSLEPPPYNGLDNPTFHTDEGLTTKL